MAVRVHRDHVGFLIGFQDKLIGRRKQALTAPATPRRIRAGIAALFSCFLVIAVRYAETGKAAVNPTELERYIQAQAVLRTLLGGSGASFDNSEQSELQNGLQQLSAATTYWSLAKEGDADLIYQAERSSAMAILRIRSVLDGTNRFERLWIKHGEPAPPKRIHQKWLNAGGMLLLRVAREDLLSDAIPAFIGVDY